MPRKGYKMPEEQRRHISEGVKHSMTDEQRARVGGLNRGKKFTDEHRHKISEAMKGKPGQVGSDNPRWRGGCTIGKDGYVCILAPDHPRADRRGYVKEHILVAEQMLGRPVEPDEHVHHINHIRHDNRPENLAVMPGSEHLRLHQLGMKKPGTSNTLRAYWNSPEGLRRREVMRERKTRRWEPTGS